jgi:hypothetical protein
MKTLIALALFLSLAVPAAFAVPPAGHGSQGNGNGKDKGGETTTGSSSTSTPSASELCKEQRRVMGMAAFRLLYAPGGSPKAAMDACLAKQVQVAPTVAKNAAQACKAERAQLGVQAFDDKYGTNKNKRNAFGKCVSLKSQQSNAQGQQTTLDAAQACKAELQKLGAQAFAAKYGTNNNKRNAFGKCVSKLASAQSGSGSSS